MTSTRVRRHTGRGRWSTAILGVVTTAAISTGIWTGTAGAAAGAPPRGNASAGRPSTPMSARTAAGTPGGLITMRQGNMEMAMTRLSGKAPTWAELQRVYTMVRSAAAATATYQTLAAAQHDGYVTAPDLLIDGQGAHYFNHGFDDKAAFDLTHPAFLVYNPVHGHEVLSGLMYYVPGSLTPAQLATIFPASMASWHKHINVCITGGTSLLNGKAIIPYFDQASCAAHKGTFSGDTGWMVHTWVGQANGAGLFDMDMPTSSAKPAMGAMPGM